MLYGGLSDAECHPSLLGWACGAGRRQPIWEISPKAQLTYKGMITSGEYESMLSAIDSRDGNTAKAALELVFNKVYSLPPNP
jgi:hypothetical protein